MYVFPEDGPHGLKHVQFSPTYMIKKTLVVTDGFWLYLCTFAKLLFAVAINGKSLVNMLGVFS
jgi:hypothetical protein